MEMLLKREKAESIIKNYYEDTYSIKNCKVNIYTRSVRLIFIQEVLLIK